MSSSGNAGASPWSWHSIWPAPAKLNLFLHVVGRRADGYHLLQTVFRFIDLQDQLRFAPRDDGRIVLATPTPGVPPQQDLVVRAAEALTSMANGHPEKMAHPRHACSTLKVGAGGTAPGVTIHLDKRIPMGGGLGGGSSDAATVLLALNQLWGCGLSRPQLESIGLTLGADVPVFIHGRSTFAEGIGEQFTDVTAPQGWYLLTRPPAQVPTLEIFRAPELKRDTPSIAAADWRDGFGHNDLAAVACARYPVIADHLALLGRFGDARMSGSGACCFVAFPDESAARAAKLSLPDNIEAFLVRGLPQHPLFCAFPD